jgi:hypothetical protein
MSQTNNTRESSLTAPEDRNREVKFQLDNVASLTSSELEDANKVLNNDRVLKTFPQVERRFFDPEINTQKIGLISFVPAKGASPNKNGIYGFAKLRGNYSSAEEASSKAKDIIEKVDSYHQIYHTYVGRPFPLTQSSDFSEEIDKVELKKDVTSSIGEDIKKKREKEQQEIAEIEKKQKELLEDVKKSPEENKEDVYTTLKTKKAQITWTYLETEKKLKQMIDIIVKSKFEIEEMDKKHPDLKNIFYDRYMNSRKEAGLSTSGPELSSTFMKYLVEDAKIPAVDEEYKKMYGSNSASDSLLSE